MAAERLNVLLLALLVVAPAAAAQQDESGGGDLSPGAFREAVGGCPNITESRVSTTVDRCAAADDLCGLECAGGACSGDLPIAASQACCHPCLCTFAEIAYYTFLAIDQPLPCDLFTVDQARFVDLVYLAKLNRGIIKTGSHTDVCR
jgi:hypothetical protein